MVDAVQVAQWLEKLRQGSLAAADLERALQRLKQGGGKAAVQRLLYLQTNTTDLESPVLGMSTVEDGIVYDAKELLADVREMVRQQKQKARNIHLFLSVPHDVSIM